MISPRIAPITLAALLVGFASNAQAQNTETFQVQISSLMSINSPQALVSRIHDATDNDQVFGAQRWTVTANNAIGATAVFQTDQAFTNTSDTSYKRDATLGLALVSGAAWTVTTAAATTDYSSGAAAEVVSVAAESSVAGSAEFDLTVTFVEETFADLAAGDYEMTVTGTLTAK